MEGVGDMHRSWWPIVWYKEWGDVAPAEEELAFDADVDQGDVWELWADLFVSDAGELSLFVVWVTAPVADVDVDVGSLDWVMLDVGVEAVVDDVEEDDEEDDEDEDEDEDEEDEVEFQGLGKCWLLL